MVWRSCLFIIGDYAYPIGPHLIKNYKSRNVVKEDFIYFLIRV